MWRAAKLGWTKKKTRFLLAFLSILYRAIDTGHLRHLPVYALATKTLQGNQPLMTAPRINGTSPAPCASSAHTMTCPVRQYRKNREQQCSTLTYYILRSNNGMPGWVVERLDHAELRACKYCMPVNHTTMQCTTKQQNHYCGGRTISGIMCRTKGVM